MATLTLPKPDDNEYLKDIGMNFYKATNDTISEASWKEGETFRIMNLSDLTGDNESNSIAKRFYDQTKVKPSFTEQGETLSVGGEIEYFNSITGETEQRSGNILTAQQANDKYGLDGRLNFNRDITVAEAQIMHERKIAEMKYQFIMSQAEGALQKYWHGMGTTAVSAMMDPVNIATLFFTFGTGTAANFMRVISQSGLNMARLRRGLKVGAIWTTAFEVPAYMQKKHEQADYTILQSFYNVLAGTALGGGLHVVGGKGADWLQGVSMKRHKAAIDLAVNQISHDKDVNVDVLLKAVRDVSKKKNIPDGKLAHEIDGADLQRAYNKRIGYKPPLLEYKPSKDDEGVTVGERENPPLDFENLNGAPLKEEDFQITGEKLGSNDGNVAVHTASGDKFYIKKPANKDWAISEMIASHILRRILGERAPLVRPLFKNGEFVGIASKWKEGKPLTMEEVKKVSENNPQAFKNFMETSMVHAWLGNRDFAAPGNLIIDVNGNIHSIDMGGSLKFRSMGEMKTDWAPDRINEIIDFLGGKNPDISKHLVNMQVEHLENAIRKIFQISNEEIEGIVRANEGLGNFNKTEANDIIFMLINRRDELARQNIASQLKEQYGKLDVKAVPKDINDRLIKDDTLQLKVDKLAQSEYGNLKNNKVKYKVFYSHKAAYEYILKQRDQLKKILTNNEIDALMTWAKSSATLRLYAHAIATNQDPIKVFKAADEMPSLSTAAMAQIKKRYNALLSAINKVKTADNFTVYSGRMANQLQGIEGLKYGPQTAAEAKLLVGKVIEVPSFLNGSLLHNKAKGFAMAAERPVLIRLHVPKGSNMTFVDKGFKNSKGFGEAEFLMPPGTKFKIRRAYFKYSHGQDDILYIDAQVIAKDPLGVQNIDDIIKNSLAYFKNKHGTVTADVELDPKIRALNAREKVQKIESDVHSKEFTQVKKEIDDLTDEIVSTNEKRLLDEVNDVNTKFNEDMKKTNLIKKALKASLNCLIGKK